MSIFNTLCSYSKFNCDLIIFDIKFGSLRRAVKTIARNILFMLFKLKAIYNTSISKLQYNLLLQYIFMILSMLSSK